MHTLLLISSVALASGHKWDNHPTDVIAATTSSLSAEAIYTRMSDLRAWEAVVPDTCARDWEWSGKTAGVGGIGMVTYTFGPLRRRLTMQLDKAEPHYNLEVHHPGKKGFTTTVRLTDAPDGATRIELKTWLSAPPAPFKGVYFKKVQPAWQACWDQVVANIAAGE